MSSNYVNYYANCKPQCSPCQPQQHQHQRCSCRSCSTPQCPPTYAPICNPCVPICPPQCPDTSVVHVSKSGTEVLVTTVSSIVPTTLLTVETSLGGILIDTANRFVVPVTGVYGITYVVKLITDANAANIFPVFSVVRNGSTTSTALIAHQNALTMDVSETAYITISATAYLSASDTIRLDVINTPPDTQSGTLTVNIDRVTIAKL